jgi:hypothetical protein
MAGSGRNGQKSLSWPKADQSISEGFWLTLGPVKKQMYLGKGRIHTEEPCGVR